MWQVLSGSYYNRINDVVPYSNYLNKIRKFDESTLTQIQADYCEEIQKVKFYILFQKHEHN